MSTVTSSHNEGYVQQVPAEAQVPLEHTLMSLVDGSRTPGGKADVEERESSVRVMYVQVDASVHVLSNSGHSRDAAGTRRHNSYH